MSDEAAGTEGTEGAGENGAAAETQPSSLDKLATSFEKFQTDWTGRFDELSKRIPEPSGDEDDEDDGADDDSGYEFSFEDDDYTDEGQLTPEAEMKALQQMIQQQVAAELGPEREKAAARERMTQANALEKKYPALREEGFQDEMISATKEFAKQLGAPALAREPALLEIVYLAHAAQEKAGDEIPAGEEQEVTLEHGGAARANRETERDEGDAIVKAATKGRYRVGAK